MTPREQWNARQRIREMIAELQTMPLPENGGLLATLFAMKKALDEPLTDAHFDTLQRRFQGHKRILAGEI